MVLSSSDFSSLAYIKVTFRAFNFHIGSKWKPSSKYQIHIFSKSIIFWLKSLSSRTKWIKLRSFGPLFVLETEINQSSFTIHFETIELIENMKIYENMVTISNFHTYFPYKLESNFSSFISICMFTIINSICNWTLIYWKITFRRNNILFDRSLMELKASVKKFTETRIWTHI